MKPMQLSHRTFFLCVSISFIIHVNTSSITPPPLSFIFRIEFRSGKAAANAAHSPRRGCSTEGSWTIWARRRCAPPPLFYV
ncbi:hypothetical protein T492DRAFT_141644 [Pavlovales sp. CCMP2436]|nr:hypothetical protein T492DRAFT_141644 [Pavlovales sp. CCMP2436]